MKMKLQKIKARKPTTLVVGMNCHIAFFFLTNDKDESIETKIDNGLENIKDKASNTLEKIDETKDEVLDETISKDNSSLYMVLWAIYLITLIAYIIFLVKYKSKNTLRDDNASLVKTLGAINLISGVLLFDKLEEIYQNEYLPIFLKMILFVTFIPLVCIITRCESKKD